MRHILAGFTQYFAELVALKVEHVISQAGLSLGGFKRARSVHMNELPVHRVYGFFLHLRGSPSG
jgi:hypothetical protein